MKRDPPNSEFRGKKKPHLVVSNLGFIVRSDKETKNMELEALSVKSRLFLG